MFKVANNKIDISHVRKRSLGFGRNDLGENSCDFIWKESIEDLLARTESIINDFIMDCHIDDKNQEEPDILFLYELNYPFIRVLLEEQPSYFLELVSEYADLLVLTPFYVTPYIGKKDDIKSGFAINQINKVYFDDDTIVFEGKGWFYNRDQLLINKEKIAEGSMPVQRTEQVLEHNNKYFFQSIIPFFSINIILFVLIDLAKLEHRNLPQDRRYIINIYRDNGKVDIDIIFKAEEIISHVFPSNYTDLVTKYDALRLENNIFDFTNVYGEKDERDVNFLSFKTDHIDGDIISNQENVSDISNFGYKNIVLFAICANGDYICFDYRHDAMTKKPKIVLVCHDEFVDHDDGTSSMVINHVADSFEDFIDMLHT